MNKPVWGQAFAAQIRQLEVIIESIGSLLLSIQKVIFSLKKVLFSIGGVSVFLALDEKASWEMFLFLFG